MGRDSKPVPSAVRLKRVYEAPETRDGVRILVDRLWPRGVSKPVAKLDAWMKELGPSDELRGWFGHQSDRWDAFQGKYRHELEAPLRQMLLAEIQGIAGGSTVTLVYGAHATEENEAVVLRDYLLRELVSPDQGWDPSMKILLTAAAVAGARGDAVVNRVGLRLFASPILTDQDIDAGLVHLLAGGQLRESLGGWQVTTLGRQQIRRLSNAGSAQ